MQLNIIESKNKPYGTIDYTDSTGPDIFKYKYTGQEYDSSTRLYYLRSRYYDPTLGRFLQADSQIMPAHTNGLNRYMYVNGQPTRGVDPSGHRFSTPLAWGIIGALTASQRGQTITQGFVMGYIYGKGGQSVHQFDRISHHTIGGFDHGLQGIVGELHQLASGFTYHHHDKGKYGSRVKLSASDVVDILIIGVTTVAMIFFPEDLPEEYDLWDAALVDLGAASDAYCGHNPSNNCDMAKAIIGLAILYDFIKGNPFDEKPAPKK